MNDNDGQAFLFADLAGFTQLTEAHGDYEAADQAGRHAESLRSLAQEYEAELVNVIGDAVMMRVPDAGKAIMVAIRIVDEVGGQHGVPAIRVGIDYGSAVERDGDYFGRVVNTAARVTDLAEAGEVLLTDAVRTAAGDIGGIEISSRGSHTLKGVSDKVGVFSAECLVCDPEERLPIDPVCKMAVDPNERAGTVEHSGVTYSFCSLDCKGKFSDSPESYVSKRPTTARDKRD